MNDNEKGRKFVEKDETPSIGQNTTRFSSMREEEAEGEAERKY